MSLLALFTFRMDGVSSLVISDTTPVVSLAITKSILLKSKLAINLSSAISTLFLTARATVTSLDSAPRFKQLNQQGSDMVDERVSKPRGEQWHGAQNKWWSRQIMSGKWWRTGSGELPIKSVSWPAKQHPRAVPKQIWTQRTQIQSFWTPIQGLEGYNLPREWPASLMIGLVEGGRKDEGLFWQQEI